LFPQRLVPLLKRIFWVSRDDLVHEVKELDTPPALHEFLPGSELFLIPGAREVLATNASIFSIAAPVSLGARL
jgi:hypothetical protein